MDNLLYYNMGREVPESAQRMIEGGHLKGKTDINPMWRIKKLTEMFGPCGFGWRVEKQRVWLEKGAGEEVAAFVEIALFVKMGEEWSFPIFGTGGSMFVSRDKNGLYTDDEAYKKAYTDAISVACKALGIGADVYWEKDGTKYDGNAPSEGERSASDGKTASASTGREGANAGGREPKKSGITLSMLRDFGVENIAGVAEYLGKKFGKPIAQLDEEETALAWQYLRRRKEEREAAEAFRRACEEDGT